MSRGEPDPVRERVPVMAASDEPHAGRLHAGRTELIGWLAGAVAHDVNNLLSVIAGYADLIDGALDPDDPRGADTAGIRDAVHRAGGLVRQLLTVGRRKTLRLETLDASELVGALQPLLVSACGDRITVRIEACPEPAAVLVDRSLIEQALLNLAVNARDAMPEGGTLTLSTSVGPSRADRDVLPAIGRVALVNSADGSPEEVRIAVEDTGVGIDETVLAHVFEPYFSTKDSGRGSGIGLAAVEEAAVRCGGAVSVDSRPGEGTRFTLHLARVPAAAAAGPLTRPAARVRRGRETILVVDGDAEVRLVLARIMQGLGYTVVDAATARQAVALAEYALDRLDLLVTEVALPDMAGPDLALRIRTQFPSAPALFLSQPARGRTATRPDDRLLAKPFTAERLGPVLRSMLDARVADAIES